MNCDLCGKEGELYKALVEGSQLTVWGSCAKYGKVMGRARTALPEKKRAAEQPPRKEEAIELVIADFGKLLKAKREQLGLSQKDFAQKIAERESVLHRMETGEVTPTLDRARELERMLGMKLVEQIKDEPVQTAK